MAEMSKNEVMFSQLVLTFQSAAWIQLGKVKNPQSNKVEKDLTQAQYSIDMLDMLLSKTKGNLNEEEDKMLSNIVTTLKMHYIKELENSKKEKTQQKPDGDKEKSPEEDN